MKPMPPTVLAIHDLSGYGRGSLTTVLTVLGSMGIQACPMPTSLLSTHTSDFEGFSFLDLTSEMQKFMDHWQSLGLKFDAIYSGFLGSPVQASMVEKCIELFSHSGTFTLIDPVLGDNGSLYPTMNKAMVSQMRHLIGKADIITPNLTEAALLLDEPYPKALDKKKLIDWLRRLSKLGPHTVIITSAILDKQIENNASVVVAYQRTPEKACNLEDKKLQKNKEEFWQVSCDYIPAYYPGTGDIFASILTGTTLWNEELPVGIARAMRFIASGIEQSENHNHPRRNGILLEMVLDSLKGPLSRTNTQRLLADD